MTNWQLATLAFLIILAESILQASFGMKPTLPQFVAGVLHGSACCLVYEILQRRSRKRAPR